MIPKYNIKHPKQFWKSKNVVLTHSANITTRRQNYPLPPWSLWLSIKSPKSKIGISKIMEV